MAINSPETPLHDGPDGQHNASLLSGADLDNFLVGFDDGESLLDTHVEIGETAISASIEITNQPSPNTPSGVLKSKEKARANFLERVPEVQPPNHSVLETDYIRPFSTAQDAGRLSRLRRTTRQFLDRQGFSMVDEAVQVTSELSGNWIRHVLPRQDEEQCGRLDICKVAGTGEIMIVCHATTELSSEEVAREEQLQQSEQVRLTKGEAKVVEPSYRPSGIGLEVIESCARENGLGRFYEEGAPTGAFSVWVVVKSPSNFTLAS